MSSTNETTIIKSEMECKYCDRYLVIVIQPAGNSEWRKELSMLVESSDIIDQH